VFLGPGLSRGPVECQFRGCPHHRSASLNHTVKLLFHLITCCRRTSCSQPIVFPLLAFTYSRTYCLYHVVTISIRCGLARSCLAQRFRICGGNEGFSSLREDVSTVLQDRVLCGAGCLFTGLLYSYIL